MFYKLSDLCDVPPIAMYNEHCTLPDDLRTFINIELVVLPLDQIDPTNEDGQESNDARAQGTDKNNISGIRSSLLSKGCDTSYIPPMVGRQKNSKGFYPLYEGFSRISAYNAIGQNQIVVLMGDIPPQYDIEDLKDEVGLGCNDHMQSKRATNSDYAKRLAKFIARGKDVSRNDCIKWFEGIKHSLTDKNIENIISDVYDLKYSAETMTAYDTSTKAVKKVAQLSGTKSEDIRVWNNKTGASFENMMRSVMEYYLEYNAPPEVYGYLNRTSAEDAYDERVKMNEKITRFNETFRAIIKDANRVQKNGGVFNMIPLKGFIPQMIGENKEIKIIEPCDI